MDAVRTLEGEVRELIRRSGLDPARDEPQVRRLVRDAVTDYEERSMHGGMPVLADTEAAAKAVWDTVAGYGPLQQYFDDPEVEEIWVNEPSSVFVARGGLAELTTTLLTHDQVRDLVERMLKPSGRRVDLSSPFVDAVLTRLSGVDGADRATTGPCTRQSHVMECGGCVSGELGFEVRRLGRAGECPPLTHRRLLGWDQGRFRTSM